MSTLGGNFVIDLVRVLSIRSGPIQILFSSSIRKINGVFFCDLYNFLFTSMSHASVCKHHSTKRTTFIVHVLIYAYTLPTLSEAFYADFRSKDCMTSQNTLRVC